MNTANKNNTKEQDKALFQTAILHVKMQSVKAKKPTANAVVF